MDSNFELLDQLLYEQIYMILNRVGSWAGVHSIFMTVICYE
ncbi:hypothetical protein SAMN04244573_03789 [Azotobacter beijerinckii]|uniref:Uncharacterized protein n=1 Tax=Azotobacter beijerinckii TaxID=170623 RepID=A0A1H9PXS8_9GAMM|nr:hypothetical protein SAMN04244573_03789 [Azotobacter beijerinckii]